MKLMESQHRLQCRDVFPNEVRLGIKLQRFFKTLLIFFVLEMK